MNESDCLVDLDAERAVLGAILYNNGALQVAEAIVAEHDFSSPVHALIFNAFVELRRTGSDIDVVTVKAALTAANRLNAIGGVQYLGELTDSIPSAAHIESHARLLAGLGARRRVREEASKIALRAADESIPIETVAEKGAAALQAASVGTAVLTSLRSVGEALDAVEERITGGERLGFSLPWPTLDRLIRGLRGGRQHVIAGLTSMGKSSFARNIATALSAPSAWRARHTSDNRFGSREPANPSPPVSVPVLFFSLEMPAEENSIQVVASCLGVSGTAIERGDLSDIQTSAYMSIRNGIDNAPLKFDGETESAARICTISRQFVAKNGRCVIIVDYLQLCGPEGLTAEKNPTRERQVAAMSRAFKRLAVSLDVPVVLLSQLSRQGDRNDECPRLSDLRESGSVEQDADVVIFLWGKRPIGNDPIQKVNCTVAKLRGGRAGVTIPMVLYREATRFEEAQGADLALPRIEQPLDGAPWAETNLSGNTQ